MPSKPPLLAHSYHRSQVAERFAAELGKPDEAAHWAAVAATVSKLYTQAYLHSEPQPPPVPGLFLRQTSYLGYATPSARLSFCCTPLCL